MRFSLTALKLELKRYKELGLHRGAGSSEVKNRFRELAKQYHPDLNWLKKRGHATDLHKVVHIPQAQSYVNLKKSNVQPWVMLHEMAHAWHDQVVTFKDPEILAAYTKTGRVDEIKQGRCRCRLEVPDHFQRQIRAGHGWVCNTCGSLIIQNLKP